MVVSSNPDIQDVVLTSSFHFTRKLVRNAEPQAPPWMHRIRICMRQFLDDL